MYIVAKLNKFTCIRTHSAISKHNVDFHFVDDRSSWREFSNFVHHTTIVYRTHGPTTCPQNERSPLQHSNTTRLTFLEQIQVPFPYRLPDRLLAVLYVGHPFPQLIAIIIKIGPRLLYLVLEVDHVRLEVLRDLVPLVVEGQPTEQERQQRLDKLKLLPLVDFLYQVDVVHARREEVAFGHVHRRVGLQPNRTGQSRSFEPDPMGTLVNVRISADERFRPWRRFTRRPNGKAASHTVIDCFCAVTAYKIQKRDPMRNVSFVELDGEGADGRRRKRISI